MSYVVPHKIRQSRNARRGTKAIEAGSTVYLLQSGDFYFIWCYTDREFASKMTEKVIGPQSGIDRAANWRNDPELCVHSDRKTFA